MLAVWHWLVHFLGVDYGVAYGHWIWYNFWSGVAGSFLVGAVVVGSSWYLNHTCHDSWRCLRYGRYEAAGGMFRLCRHHHPDLKGTRPHRELIARLHREHQERLAS
jgi:hypothetical protein